MRCVTVDGDVYDPGATITGGSSPRNNNILERLCQLNELQRQLEDVTNRFNTITRDYEELERLGSRFRDLDATVRRKEYEIKSLQNLIDKSPASQVLPALQ
jgi:chromosome segregation ATPase